MKKNIIANLINILFSIVFMLIVFLANLNPLSLIISFMLATTNMLLSVYTMGLTEYPSIRIGNVESSVFFCNLAAVVMQGLLIIGALSGSLWISLLSLFSVLVFIEVTMVFLKKLYKFLRFHISITFSVSFTVMVLYCILLAYRQYGTELPTTLISVCLIILYIILIIKQKKLIYVTAYSTIFCAALMILSVGSYSSQGIYSAILYIISYSPVMFLLMLSCYNISDTYKEQGVYPIKSVLVHLPISGVGYFIGLLAILGFPPFSLFFGRLSIIQSSVTSGDDFKTILIMIIIVLSSCFVLARVMPALFGSKNEKLIGIKENRYTIAILIFLIMAVILLTILIPGFISELISNARAYVVGAL